MLGGSTVSVSKLELDEYLPYQVAVTGYMVSSRIIAEYNQKFGLKVAEWRIVVVLGEGKPLTQRALVDLTLLDKVTINRATKILEDRGVVERRAHDQDGRSHLLNLTPKGENVYAQLVPQALAAERRIERDLLPQERTELMRLLRKLQTAAEVPLR